MNEFCIGMILISGDIDNFNHIRSGVRITDITGNGLVVQRIHAMYLNDDPIESWTIRNHQIPDMQWRPLPIGYQMPLL